MILLGMLALLRVQTQDAEPVRLPITESVRIGSAGSSEYAFRGITAVRAMAGGNTAAIIWAPGETRVAVFDANGRARWTHKFASDDAASSLAVSGDTVAVLAGYGETMRLFRFHVGHDRPVSVIPVRAMRGETLSLAASLAGPIVLVTSITATGDGPLPIPLTHPVVELRAVGPREVSPSAFYSRTDPAPRAITTFSSPLGPIARAASVPWTPRVSIAAAGGVVYVAGGDGYDVDVLRMSGAPVESFHPPVLREPITASQREEWFTQWRNGAGRAQYSDSALQLIHDLPSPQYRPVIRQLFASPSGELAVVRADLSPTPVGGGDSVRVDVVLSGTIRGRFVLPPGTQIESFDGTSVLTVLRDTTKIVGHSREAGAAPQYLHQIVRYVIGQ